MDPQSPGWPPSLHSSSLGSLGRRQWSNTRQALREQKYETPMPSLFPYCLWDTGEHKWRVGRTTRMAGRDGHPSTRKIIRSARTLLPTQGIRHSPSRGKEYRATEWSEQAEKSQAWPELLSQVAEISPEKRKLKLAALQSQTGGRFGAGGTKRWSHILPSLQRSQDRFMINIK